MPVLLKRGMPPMLTLRCTSLLSVWLKNGQIPFSKPKYLYCPPHLATDVLSCGVARSVLASIGNRCPCFLYIDSNWFTDLWVSLFVVAHFLKSSSKFTFTCSSLCSFSDSVELWLSSLLNCWNCLNYLKSPAHCHGQKHLACPVESHHYLNLAEIHPVLVFFLAMFSSKPSVKHVILHNIILQKYSTFWMIFFYIVVKLHLLEH